MLLILLLLLLLSPFLILLLLLVLNTLWLVQACALSRVSVGFTVMQYARMSIHHFPQGTSVNGSFGKAVGQHVSGI